MKNQTQINCPDCGSQIDVNDILKKQLEETIKQEYQSKYFDQHRTLKKEQSEFEKEKQDFKAELNLAKKELEKNLKVQLKAEVEEEQSYLISSMEQELKDKSNKVKELHKKEGEILKLKRDIKEVSSLARLEAQKEIDALLKKENNA